MATGAPSAALSRSSRRFATSVVGQNRRGDRRLSLLPPVRAAMRRRVIRVGCKDPPASCRSRMLKLRAARPWKRRVGWEQP
jgi:hypothetical protein